MQLGMVGLGRMGSNMVRRLLRAHHQCIVYDIDAANRQALAHEGAIDADSLAKLVGQMAPPRAIWLMLPAAIVDTVIQELVPFLDANDTIIDGGNSFYQDAIRRAESLWTSAIHFIDVGTSGGVWGLENGYCLMIGGNDLAVIDRLDPIFAALSPRCADSKPPEGGKERASKTQTAAAGYLHCGPSGAGHFVKMIHNGIEYGIMASYAEGFNILHKANIGKLHHEHSAETTPLKNPAHYQYDFDLAQIAELWRHGSVVRSWLLDLLGAALSENPRLEKFHGSVSDSGEGRWTIVTAIEEGVPTPTLSSALFSRFSSRGEATFADQVLSALRFAFGGHLETTASPQGDV